MWWVWWILRGCTDCGGVSLRRLVTDENGDKLHDDKSALIVEALCGVVCNVLADGPIKFGKSILNLASLLRDACGPKQRKGLPRIGGNTWASCCAHAGSPFQRAIAALQFCHRVL